MPKTIVCQRDGCPRYHLPMKPIDEYVRHVLYVCPFDGAGLRPRGCGAARLISKHLCGGTIGAGKADVCEKALRGTHTLGGDGRA